MPPEENHCIKEPLLFKNKVQILKSNSVLEPRWFYRHKKHRLVKKLFPVSGRCLFFSRWRTHKSDLSAACLFTFEPKMRVRGMPGAGSRRSRCGLVREMCLLPEHAAALAHSRSFLHPVSESRLTQQCATNPRTELFLIFYNNGTVVQGCGHSLIATW